MTAPAGQVRVARTVALMVTRRCNMACSHCSVESHSGIRAQPEEEWLGSMLDDAASAGVSAILFTGGEPMLRQSLIVRLLARAKKNGLASAMTTNGFWGRTLPEARRIISRMRKAGLNFLTLSYDRYHAEFQGPAPGANVLRAAGELGMHMNVNVTREANDSEIGQLIRPYENERHARIRLYDVQRVGRAKDIPAESLRNEVSGACDGALIPAITDDRRVTACNGPAYFQAATSPLVVGSLDTSSLHELLLKHQTDPILQTIRTFGPSRLRAELSQIPGFENFPWRNSYSGLCELCLHINSDVEASSALRDRLSQPELTAERVGRQLVMDGVEARGMKGRKHSIGVGAAWLWMSAARGERETDRQRWDGEAERLLGRPDTDWRHITDYISACGMSRVVLPFALDPAITRWAPAMFREPLEADALREGRRELVQRSVLDFLDGQLREMGSQGVLLKGTAFLVRDLAPIHDGSRERTRFFRRSADDIDILVDSRVAEAFRRRILERGGTGERNAARTGPHHLAPVMVQGMPIEIHTRIMPSFWRLPETQMLARKQALPQYSSLSTLDAEGMMLHALMHCASHVFGCGLKTAWDVSVLLERNPGLDVSRIVDWVDKCAMPSGFYLPAELMQSALGVPVPDELLLNSPRGSRFDTLRRVVRDRLFIAMEGTSELNPITKHGLFLLLHTTWTGRVRHLSSLFGTNEVESRNAARNVGSTPGIAFQFRESAKQFRSYRRLSAEARAREQEERVAQLFASS